MQAKHDPSIDLSAVIGAIPNHLKARFHKEIHHAFATNLCVYGDDYVTHTVIHFTSAETQHVAMAIEDVKMELETNAWHMAVRQSDPQFIEVYLSSNVTHIEPLNLSAFAEATGLDISDVRAPLPEPAAPQTEIEPEVVAPTLHHDHHVSGMLALQMTERVCAVLASAFPEQIEQPHAIKTSASGPHVLVTAKTGEMFGVWPDEDGEVPAFRFGVLDAPQTIKSEIILNGYSELVLHFADYLEPEKPRRFQLFRRLTESPRILARFRVDYRLAEIVVTEKDGTGKSVKTISEATETQSLFNLRIVSESGASDFVATADDMENLILTH